MSVATTSTSNTYQIRLKTMNGEEQVSELIFERIIPLRLLGNSHVICSSAASAFDHRSGGPYCARSSGTVRPVSQRHGLKWTREE